MFLFSLSGWLKNANRNSRLSRRDSRRMERSARLRFVPQLENLEDRTVPSTLTVTSAADDGSNGTLRAVIAGASPGDTIKFAKQLKGDTITLTQGQLTISQDLTIKGLGADDLTISGNSASRVFDITNGSTVEIAKLTIADGLAVQGAGIEDWPWSSVSAARTVRPVLDDCPVLRPADWLERVNQPQTEAEVGQLRNVFRGEPGPSILPDTT